MKKIAKKLLATLTPPSAWSFSLPVTAAGLLFLPQNKVKTKKRRRKKTLLISVQ